MIKILSHDQIPPRVLIKKVESETRTKKSNVIVPMDKDALPRAEIVMVADRIKDIVSPGDKVYYMNNIRGLGKVIYEGKEHWTTEIGNIVAIYERANGKDN